MSEKKPIETNEDFDALPYLERVPVTITSVFAAMKMRNATGENTNLITGDPLSALYLIGKENECVESMVTFIRQLEVKRVILAQTHIQRSEKARELLARAATAEETHETLYPFDERIKKQEQQIEATRAALSNEGLQAMEAIIALMAIDFSYESFIDDDAKERA